MELPEPLANSTCAITLPVLWGDMDALGHVNNVVAFRWFESARVAMLEQVGLSKLMEPKRIGPILAAVDCQYKLQIFYPDTVWVSACVSSVGRTSMQIKHRIYSQTEKTIAAEGNSVVVFFDYNRQRPVAVPPDIRAELEGTPNGPVDRND